MPQIPSEDRGPPLYWRLMRICWQQFGYFTSTAIRELAGNRHRHTIQLYIEFLRTEGVVRITDETRHGGMVIHRYVIERDGDAPPSRRPSDYAMGSRQQALWTAMRAIGAFSPGELALAASTEQLRIAPETARSFVFDLKKAGYVAELAGAKYRLLPARNSGPRAPIILRGRGAFDLNLMRSVNVTAQPVVQHDGRAA